MSGASGAAGSASRDMIDRLFAESVDRFELSNGLIVVHQEDYSAEVVAAQLWVKTGSIHEGRHLGAGLSHFLEHMVFKGTGRRDCNAISREIQAVGGQINAYTSFDRTVYYVDMPSEHAALGIDILCDICQHARLPAEAIASEKQVILREIDMGADDPDRRVSRALFSTAFQHHPYRYPVIGLLDLVAQVTADDLAEYYARRYVPNNMVLVVVGAMSGEALRTCLEQTFAQSARGRYEPVYVPAEPPQIAPRQTRLHGELTVCRGGMAFRIPSLTHPDSPALDTLAALLGNGYSSHLWQALREQRRLVQHVEVSAWNPGTSGLFWISYTCEPAKRAAVEAAIMEELARFGERGVDHAALEKVRRQALVGEINTRKTMNGRAGRLGLSEAVVGELGYPRAYFERLDAIEPRDLSAVLARYRDPAALTTVSLMPEPKSSVAGARAAAAAAGGSDFELITLRNGARLIWQRDDRLPKVHLRMVGHGGPSYENREQRGITGVLATLMTRDTRFRSALEAASAVEQVGGYLSEFVGNNTFGLSTEVLTDDLDVGLRAMEEAMLFPEFRDEAFEREREAQMAQIHEDMDEIVEAGRRALRHKFFGAHPFAIDAYGELDTLGALTLDDVRAHYERLMVGSNVVFSVAGAFDPDVVLPRVESILLNVPDWALRGGEDAFERPATVGTEHLRMEREQSVVFLAFPDVGICPEETLVGELLDEIYSDMSGRLFTNVREKRHLAYYVGASRLLGERLGMFCFYGGTQPETAPDLLHELWHEVERSCAGDIAHDAFERARTRLKVRRRMAMQSIGSRAAQAALNVTYGLPLNDWRLYDARLDAVRFAQLGEFAARHFTRDKGLALIVGPR